MQNAFLDLRLLPNVAGRAQRSLGRTCRGLRGNQSAPWSRMLFSLPADRLDKQLRDSQFAAPPDLVKLGGVAGYGPTLAGQTGQTKDRHADIEKERSRASIQQGTKEIEHKQQKPLAQTSVNKKQAKHKDNNRRKKSSSTFNSSGVALCVDQVVKITCIIDDRAKWQ